jgi:hypothetical protein
MAAGLGYIEFATGDILTAAAANGYLASQTVMVFASASARTSAITSPQEGMMSYLKDTNATEYYSGSAWVALGGGSSGALTFLARTSFSGVASQAFDSVFSSTYKSYMVVVEKLYSTTAGNDFQLLFRYGTSSVSTGYYGSSFNVASGATQATQNNNDSILTLGADTGSSSAWTTSTLFFNNVGTSAEQPFVRGISATANKIAYFGGYNSQTSNTITGFLLQAESNINITGTVAIYGLAAA